jgi:hypothetical protein
MKRTITTLLITICILNMGCVKSLLDKKKEDTTADPNKYAGLWKATKIALDQDGDNSLDENEKGDLNGNSELRMNSNGSFTYSLVANGGGTPLNLSGNWKLSDDKKSVTITDNSKGSIRFDIKSDNEIITEPIPSNGKSAWIIYLR